MYYLPKLLKKIHIPAIKDSRISKKAKIEAGSTFINSSIEKYSFCGYDCIVINTDIGAFCSLAGNIKIGLAKHPIEWTSTSCAFYYGRDSIKKVLAQKKYNPSSRRVMIGNDVWIGENAVIMGGVKVGNGAIIGASAVVTHDIGNYEIWAGNPARYIRKRFPEEIIDMLNKSKWWEFSDVELKKISDKIDNPFEFAQNALMMKSRGELML